MASRKSSLENFLRDFKDGKLTGDALLRKLAKYFYHSHYQVIGNTARLDTHRRENSGVEEVIYGEGKSPEQLQEIITAVLEKKTKNGKQIQKSLLITRLSPQVFSVVQKNYESVCGKSIPLVYHPQAGVAHTFKVNPVTFWRSKSSSKKSTISNKIEVSILTAGTSDSKVAEECFAVLNYWGIRAERYYDVGVAGLGRLLGVINKVRKSKVVIVIAGMEAALASVVGGLVTAPVIAVPTSIGYGANFEGLSSLLGMINSCSPGVMVVNVDNGFGAATAARKIIKLS